MQCTSKATPIPTTSAYLGKCSHLEAKHSCQRLLTEQSREGCDPPTCWTQEGNFYNRVHPDSYKGGNEFKLDVSKYWFYRSPSLFPSTLDVVEGSTSGYHCDKVDDSQVQTCTLDNAEALTSEWAVKYWGDAVMPSPIC
jgi:hypothetical protein